ncbi:MAG: PEP/pyruvate-binding domain-containing protein [Methyloceanibacter sp.]|jgi:phosphoenolpyruvate synthase/pyruvate phosphate dikinase
MLDSTHGHVFAQGISSECLRSRLVPGSICRTGHTFVGRYAPALKPIVHKRCGGKALKIIYTRGSGQPTRNVPTSLAERSSLVLTDSEILQLARSACVIERHYGCPMDIEWAKDGRSGELFIVQARPETVQSRAQTGVQRTYTVARKGRKLTSVFLAVCRTVCRCHVQ